MRRVSKDDIADAAVRWVRRRDEARRLRRERNALECEREIDAVDKMWPKKRNPSHTQEEPCWKWIASYGPEDAYTLPQDEWCATCRKRQEIHRKASEATASAGAFLRVLLHRVHREAG